MLTIFSQLGEDSNIVIRLIGEIFFLIGCQMIHDLYRQFCNQLHVRLVSPGQFCIIIDIKILKKCP